MKGKDDNNNTNTNRVRKKKEGIGGRVWGVGGVCVCCGEKVPVFAFSVEKKILTKTNR